MSEPVSGQAKHQGASVGNSSQPGRSKPNPPGAKPRLVNTDPEHSLQVLLNLEGEIRSIDTVPELGYFV